MEYGNADLLDYAPVTRAHVKDGYMTLGELCAAAIEYSDNTAANLILGIIGGPQAVTRYARTLGDRVTTLDNTEPKVNRPLAPGEIRDTTSPEAMAADVQAIVLGNALSSASRRQVAAWLQAGLTGATCLRAGFPASWRVGDKTGLGGALNATGDSDTRNDIAIAWPLTGAPIVVAAYLTGSTLAAKPRDAILASVGRAATSLASS